MGGFRHETILLQLPIPLPQPNPGNAREVLEARAVEPVGKGVYVLVGWMREMERDLRWLI